MKQQAYTVFTSRYFTWPALVLSVFFIIIIILSGKKELVLLPSEGEYDFYYYTDAANGGNSEVKSFTKSDSLIRMDFLLREKFTSPYVGINLSPLQSEFIDANNYNQLKITVKGQNIDRIGIGFFTPPVNRGGELNSYETIHHSYLDISKTKQTYSMPLKDLKHPGWWIDLHNIDYKTSPPPDLSKITHIIINSAYISDRETLKSLEVYSIAFERDNRKFIKLLIVSLFGILIVLFLFLYYREIGIAKGTVTIEYKPLDISAKPEGYEERCLHYIADNFKNSNLKLDAIACEVGTTPRNITHIIHNRFGCNVKTYLNHLRINEAKTLLAESDLNINEIAYLAGFNSSSHFNRVFKNELKLSPSEYRNTHQEGGSEK